MKTRTSLQRIEGRLWLRTFEHGLWDVAIGLLILSFGLGILTQIYWIAAILVPVAWPGMYELAERAIAPRIGHATFRGRRKRSLSHICLILTALAVAGMGAFAFMNLSSGPQAPEWVVWVRSHFVIVMGLMWGGALAVAGWAVDLPRLYAYGALLFGALVVADVATTGYALAYALVATGGLIALIGIGLFARFLRRYPRLPEPEGGKIDD